MITGASKGIGRATTLFLHERGFRVFAGVRSPQDGDDLMRETSERVTPVTLDVTSAGQIGAAQHEVQERVGERGLQGLINNAGMVVAGPLEALPLDAFRRQLEVNLTGVLAVTQAFLPLVRTGGGRIVNVSSINGRVAVPFVGAYAVSKFALEALTDALRMELARWDIAVSSIQPGAVQTPIWATSVRRARDTAAGFTPEGRALYGRAMERIATQPEQPPKRSIPPERVARVIHRALTARTPRTRYLVGPDARLAAFLSAVLPDRVMDRVLVRRRK